MTKSLIGAAFPMVYKHERVAWIYWNLKIGSWAAVCLKNEDL